MPIAHNGDISLYYETVGRQGDPPIVLVEGLSAQLIGWPESFVDLIVGCGFQVIRHDNRDVGLSSMTGGPLDLDGGYTLSDMADDTAAVMSAAGHESFHVVGQSMGGMIAQRLYAFHQEKVRSGTLFYSAARPELHRRSAPAPVAPSKVLPRSEAIATLTARERVCSPGATDEELLLIDQKVMDSVDRSYRPDGVVRQTISIRASKPVVHEIQTSSIPTSIIHGRLDPFFDVSAAIELSETLPQSDLHLYGDLGHSIAPHLWDQFAGIIERTVRLGELVAADSAATCLPRERSSGLP
ncbi:hypothetical protein AXA44_08505 [Rhodococcus sp. SC4]|nr:hypothetical protein AXA44_08505 [Rhodococcus sp. SC4]